MKIKIIEKKGVVTVFPRESLEGNRQKIEYEDARKIARYLRNNVNVTALSFHCCFLTGISAMTIALAIINHDHLSRLDWGHTRLKDKGVLAIFKIFSTNNYLDTINLQGNEITHVGLEIIENALSNKDKLNLTWLDLSFNKLADEGLQALISILKDQPSLHYLNLAGNQISNLGAVELLDALIEADDDLFQCDCKIDLSDNLITFLEKGGKVANGLVVDTQTPQKYHVKNRKKLKDILRFYENPSHLLMVVNDPAHYKPFYLPLAKAFLKKSSQEELNDFFRESIIDFGINASRYLLKIGADANQLFENKPFLVSPNVLAKPDAFIFLLKNTSEPFLKEHAKIILYHFSQSEIKNSRMNKSLLERLNQIAPLLFSFPKHIPLSEQGENLKEEVMRLGSIRAGAKDSEITRKIKSSLYTDSIVLRKLLESDEFDCFEPYIHSYLRPILEFVAFFSDLSSCQGKGEFIMIITSDVNMDFKVMLEGYVTGLLQHEEDENIFFIQFCGDTRVFFQTLFHEWTHFIFYKLYDNASKPFYFSEVPSQEEIKIDLTIIDILIKLQQRHYSNLRDIRDKPVYLDKNQKLLWSTIESVFTDYQDEENQEEIAVKVPEILGGFGVKEGERYLSNDFPELLKYFKKQTLPAIKAYLDQKQIHFVSDDHDGHVEKKVSFSEKYQAEIEEAEYCYSVLRETERIFFQFLKANMSYRFSYRFDAARRLFNSCCSELIYSSEEIANDLMKLDQVDDFLNFEHLINTFVLLIFREKHLAKDNQEDDADESKMFLGFVNRSYFNLAFFQYPIQEVHKNFLKSIFDFYAAKSVVGFQEVLVMVELLKTEMQLKAKPKSTAKLFKFIDYLIELIGEYTHEKICYEIREACLNIFTGLSAKQTHQKLHKAVYEIRSSMFVQDFAGQLFHSNDFFFRNLSWVLDQFKLETSDEQKEVLSFKCN